MGRMSAVEAGGAKRHAETLLALARASIEHGLGAGGPLEIDPEDYPPELREVRATFVTLRRRGELRGCTGSLDAQRPLVADIAHVAHRSAFSDPRFPALTRAEFHEIDGADHGIVGYQAARTVIGDWLGRVA